MKFENTQVFNFEGALRGMRNPKNSWNKSDSWRDYDCDNGDIYMIGANDMKLATTLIKAGSFHCGVWEDITPIEKQDYERRFWDLFNGGKIQ